MKRIYLDYASTTPLDPRVQAAMRPYFGAKFGNPGSLHSFGQEAIAAVDAARETIAGLLRADFREIVFTGSATEANNLALRGAVRSFRRAHPGLVPKVVISAVEHESVAKTAEAIAEEGGEAFRVPVNGKGELDLAALEKALDARTAVVSVMHAQNETGAVFDIARIGRMVADFKKGKGEAFPLFHADAAQAFQFLPCLPGELELDLMTLSAHKICGPKGAGALYVRAKAPLAAVLSGGGQEFGLRSGTENVPLLAGFAKAAELAAAARGREASRLAALSAWFEKEIRRIAPRAKLNGAHPSRKEHRLPNIMNVYFPGHPAEELLMRLDLQGIAVSAGSACASRSQEPSGVLLAMGYGPERARESIRFSFGRMTSAAELRTAIRVLRNVFNSKKR